MKRAERQIYLKDLIIHFLRWSWYQNFCRLKVRSSFLYPVNSTVLVIPVTRRVKGYTRFVGKYVTGRRKLFWPHKVYIFLIRVTSRVDLAMSVCPSVCPDNRWGLLRFVMQIPEPTLTPTNPPKLWLLQFWC